MLKRYEGSFKGHDETELFYQTWVPASVTGTIVLTHGLAEHSDCYQNFAQRVGEWGLQTVAWDLRGHGRSAGNRGYVDDISDYEKDLFLLDQLIDREMAPAFKVLFGHSMGGLISLRFALRYGPLSYKALVLSSPALGLSMAVPQLKEMVGRVARRWLPKLTLHHGINYEDLSRDPEIIAAYNKDTLRHEKISPGLFFSMLESFQSLPQQVGQLELPVLMQLSGKDRLVNAKAAEEIFALLKRSSGNRLHIYADSLHEIYNDLDKDKVFKDLKDFLEEQM